MKKQIIALILYFIIFTSYSQNKKEVLTQVEKNISQEQFSEALLLLDKKILNDSSDYELYLKRAEVFQNLEKNQEAQNDFEKALILNPKSVTVYDKISFFHYKLNYFENAIQESTLGLNLPDNQGKVKNSLLFTRAESYSALEDNMKALADYEIILKNNPIESIESLTLISIAKLMVKLKRNEDAILALEKCVKKYPSLTIAHVNLANRYTEKGEYQKAISLNDKALELTLNLKKDKRQNVLMSKKVTASKGSDATLIAVIYNNRGFAKYKLGQLKESLIDINKSIELYPENSYAYKNRALVNISLNNKELACKDIEKAIELNFVESYGNEILELRKNNCN